MKIDVPPIEELVDMRDQLIKKAKIVKKDLDELNGMIAFILKTTPDHEALVGERRVFIEYSLSVSTDIDEARALGATAQAEIIDSNKLKQLFIDGVDVPGVVEIQKVKVVGAKIRKEKEEKEVKAKKGLVR
jgi:hypothetical protein